MKVLWRHMFGTLCAVWLATGCGSNPNPVVVYCSQDQVYAEPILQDFQRRSGIRVLPVFDSEAVKTVGLAKRLLAESNRPVADVFWSNEEMRARDLMDRKVLASWTPTVYRTRRLAYHSGRVSKESLPESFEALTNRVWRGRFAIAYPFAGTTATHLHALRIRWGEERWLRWIDGLLANNPKLVDGNSLVVQMIERGAVDIGITDIDDIRAARRRGAPIAAAPPFVDGIAIRNAVAIVANAPHPKNAIALHSYLTSPEVDGRLIDADAAEGAGRPTGIEGLHDEDWPKIQGDLEWVTDILKERFLTP